MKTLKFKSNIKCSGCIAKVAAAMKDESGIAHWEVDIYTPEKILTVQTEDLTEDEVKKIVASVGYTAESV
jgi:copper chaperone